jgi:transcriptional regulator with XRE-family HTH domain
VRFGEYLKRYRKTYHITQEELVQALYNFDDTLFQGLDTTTVSKWERSVTQPKLAKQVRILQYFQQKSGMAFPALQGENVEETEKLICRSGFENLILNRSRELVLNFPEKTMNEKNLRVDHIRHSDRMDAVLEITADIRNSNNPSFFHITVDQLREWALHPSNLFLVCNYKEIVTGLLFSLRLKPDTFNHVMQFEKGIQEITIEDIAAFDEPGANYIIAFLALNGKSASMLFLRYYAHLIARQESILSVGVTTALADARKIIENMDLEHIKTFEEEGIRVDSYEASLQHALASENVVKMILRREECPEE